MYSNGDSAADAWCGQTFRVEVGAGVMEHWESTRLLCYDYYHKQAKVAIVFLWGGGRESLSQRVE